MAKAIGRLYPRHSSGCHAEIARLTRPTAARDAGPFGA